MSESEPQHAVARKPSGFRGPLTILAALVGVAIVVALFFALQSVWRSYTTDFQVFDSDTLAVLGRLSPRGKYRNMVIGLDEISGRIAIIEWGDSASTLKIVHVDPFQVLEHGLDAGRLTGIDGQMRYDFAQERFIFVTGNEITSLTLEGDKRKYAIPLRKGYGITGNMMPTPEGLFLVSGTPYGDDAGLALHRIAPDGAVQQFFHSNGHIGVVGMYGPNICVVETPKDRKGSPRLLKIERASFSRSEHTLRWAGAWEAQYAMAGDKLVSLSHGKTMLRSAALNSPDDVREYAIPTDKDYGIYDLAGAQNYAVVMRSNRNTGYHSHLLINLTTAEAKVKSGDQYDARLRVLHSRGKHYGIICD